MYALLSFSCLPAITAILVNYCKNKLKITSTTQIPEQGMCQQQVGGRAHEVVR